MSLITEKYKYERLKRVEVDGKRRYAAPGGPPVGDGRSQGDQQLRLILADVKRAIPAGASNLDPVNMDWTVNQGAPGCKILDGH